MIILGIESTCDETACSIVKDGREILANVVSSQILLHQEFGGVVPELACRRHVDVMIPVIDEALRTAGLTLDQVDVIAVAQGPGLIGALLIGLSTAKALAIALGKPYVGVNHIQAHLYAAMMSHSEEITFPCLGVVLSGGHTSLIKMDGMGTYEPIGKTVDDAIGEAFDKVAKILGLPYPGGPEIEALAKQATDPVPFRPGKVKGQPLDFSFSGLKTAVLYSLAGQNSTTMKETLTHNEKCNIAAGFQHAALSDVVNKTLLATEQFGYRTIVFGGGVTNNKKLREMFSAAAPKAKLLWPATGLSLDNAAMIAGLGYHIYQGKRRSDPLELEAFTR